MLWSISHWRIKTTLICLFQLNFRWHISCVLQQKICSDHHKTQQAFIQPGVNESFSSLCHSMTHAWTDTYTSDLSFKYVWEPHVPSHCRQDECVCVTHNKCCVVLGADCFVKGSYAVSGPEIQVSSSILQNLYELCTAFQLRRHRQRTFCQHRSNCWLFRCMCAPFIFGACNLPPMKYLKETFRRMFMLLFDCQDFFF